MSSQAFSTTSFYDQHMWYCVLPMIIHAWLSEYVHVGVGSPGSGGKGFKLSVSLGWESRRGEKAQQREKVKKMLERAQRKNVNIPERLGAQLPPSTPNTGPALSCPTWYAYETARNSEEPTQIGLSVHYTDPRNIPFNLIWNPPLWAQSKSSLQIPFFLEISRE